MEIKYSLIENLIYLEHSNQSPTLSIKLNNCPHYLEKEELLNYLQEDGVETETITSIKYFDEESKSHFSFPEKLNLTKKSKELRIVLVVKINESFPIYHLSELEMKINLIEDRISEIKDKLDSTMLTREQSDFFSESGIEIAFLYSNPLIKYCKNKLVAMNDPVGFETEINSLVDTFRSSKKKISACFEVAKIETFLSAIRMNPKILHISCHGSFEESDNKFYLHFEDDCGRLFKVDLENLKELLKTNEEETQQTEVVFVSACHSEAIADVFRQANVPVVICVHSSTQILDEAARKFSKIFYNSLLDGKSISYSFEQAKGVVSVAIDKSSNSFHCCCSHNHKPNCNWKNSTKNSDEAHQVHLRNCTCNYEESHIHTKRCNWANYFMKLFNITEHCDYDNNRIKVCCCSPEIAHDESNKFILKMDPEYKNKALFSGLQNGNLEIKNKNCFLNLNLAVDIKTQLIGRNRELYEIFEYLCNENLNKNRLVTLYGEKGVGKNSLSKLAGRYMFERNFFSDGIVYITTFGHVTNDMWILSKILSGLEIDDINNHSIYDIKQFCKLIGNLKIFIIIQFTSESEESIQDFKRLLNTIIENTISIKFIVSMSKPLEISKYEKKIQLMPLDDFSSAKLLKALAGSHLPDRLKNNFNSLVKDEIIKISLGMPNKIHKIACILQEHNKYEDAIERIKKENLKMESLSNELIKVLVQNLNMNNQNENDSFIYELLYILSILPNGILECEIIELFKTQYKEVLDVLEYMSSNTMIISKTNNKELRTNHYLLSPDLISSIDSLSIKDEVKTKIYKDLIKYYSSLCRHIVSLISNNSSDNTTAYEFSAAQNNGLWYSFNKTHKLYKEENVYEPVKRFNFDETNIMNIIRVENKNLKFLINSKDEAFIEALEQLTICVPTILKLNRRIKDCISFYDHFINLCKFYSDCLMLAHGRLLLFTVGVQLNISNKNNGILSIDKETLNKLSNNISTAKAIFNSKSFEEGIAECAFAKAVLKSEMEKVCPKEMNFCNFEYEIKMEFYKSLEIYKQIFNEISLARVLYTMAEYQINFHIITEEVLNNYTEALEIFIRNNLPLFRIKTLLGISKFHLESKNFALSQKYAEESKDIIYKLKGNIAKKIILQEIKEKINEIIEKSVSCNMNICVFLTASHLIKKNSDLVFMKSNSTELFAYQSVRDFDFVSSNVISYNSKFSQKIKEKLSETKKKLILKFDFLTEENLKYYLSKTGKVLCLFSEDYSKTGSLITENLQGESNEISPNYLQNILNRIKINYDIVILAIPQSGALAKLFFKAGVKKVIWFEFIEEFLNKAKIIPIKSFNILIEDFVTLFTNKLVTEKYDVAFKHAQKEFITNLLKFDNNMSSFYLVPKGIKDSSELGDVNLLCEEDITSHSKAIFDLEEGEVLDLSIKKGRMINFNKRGNVFVGRKEELYEGIAFTLECNFVNIYGDTGIGKTTLIQEICYYLHFRNYFTGGVFYFDLNSIDKWHNLKELFQRELVFSAIEESNKSSLQSNTNNIINQSPSIIDNKILIVLDNIDNLLEFTDNNVFLQLSALNWERKNIHFILTSTSKINNKNNELMEFINLNSLKPVESAYMFLYYCKRTIFYKELDFDNYENSAYSNKDDFIPIAKDSKNLSELIQFSNRFKLCKGYPKFIKSFAEKASFQTLNSIDYNDFLPKHLVRSLQNRNYQFYGQKSSKENEFKIYNHDRNSVMSNNYYNHRNNKEARSHLTENILFNCNNKIDRSVPNKQKDFSENSNEYILEHKKPKRSLATTYNYYNSIYNSMHSVSNNKKNNNTLSMVKEEILSKDFCLQNFENPNACNTSASEAKLNLISASRLFPDLKDSFNLIKVPTYRYCSSSKKWKIISSSSEPDLITNNQITLLSKQISTSNRLVSLENYIIAMTPDFVTLQNVNTQFLEQISSLKFVRDTYLISSLYCGNINSFSVIFSKYSNHFYTLDNPDELQNKFLFSVYDVVTHEGVDKILLSTVDDVKSIDILKILFNQVSVCILTCTGELNYNYNFEYFKDVWQIFKKNNNYSEEEGITDFKNKKRIDKILYKDINEKSNSFDLMEIIGQNTDMDRAIIVASFSLKR